MGGAGRQGRRPAASRGLRSESLVFRCVSRAERRIRLRRVLLGEPLPPNPLQTGGIRLTASPTRPHWPRSGFARQVRAFRVDFGPTPDSPVASEILGSRTPPPGCAWGTKILRLSGERIPRGG